MPRRLGYGGLANSNYPLAPISVNQVVETDLSQAVSVSKTKSLLYIDESDSSLLLSSIKLKILNNVSEIDLSQPIGAGGGFSYYSPITVNSGQVPSAQSDFPFLINYVDDRFKTVSNGGHVQNSNGYDIRPFSNSSLTSAMVYELERYNGTTGEVVMRVRVPSITDGSVVYLAYGNSDLTTDGSNPSTWNNNCVWSLLFNETSGTIINDSTPNGNDWTKIAENEPSPLSSGKVGPANEFDGVDDGATRTPIATGTTFSIAGWIQPRTQISAYGMIVGKGDGTVGILLRNNGKLTHYFSGDHENNTALPNATWSHFALVVNNGDGTWYLNGSPDGTMSGVPDQDWGTIGKDSAAENMKAYLDDLQFWSVALTANWIQTEFNNENAPSTFATLGDEQNAGGGFTIFVNQISEADSAFSVSLSNILGLSIETDEPFILTGVKSRLIDTPAESDISQDVVPFGGILLGLASEIDLSQTIDEAKLKVLNLSAEIDSSFSFGILKVKLLGFVSESDTSLLASGIKSIVLGLNSESDVASFIDRIKIKIIGLNTEFDLSQSLVISGFTPVGLVSEVDLSQTITKLKFKSIGQPFELDSSSLVQSSKLRFLLQVAESDNTQSIGRYKLKVISQIGELDESLNVDSAIGRLLGIVIESDESISFLKSKLKALGLSTELDQVTPVLLFVGWGFKRMSPGESVGIMKPGKGVMNLE
jgi:hypothetical protein